MDNNSLQPSCSQPDYSYPPGSINEPNEIMPPLAPSYKRWNSPAEGYNYTARSSEQQTLDRLMDSVHKGRMEEIHMGQYTAELHVNEAHIVNGAIEIQASITPKSIPEADNSRYRIYSNPAPSYYQPTYLYPPQYSCQPQYQMSYPPPYQPTYQLQSQYPYSNPVFLPQYPLRFSQLPTAYPYQYPLPNVTGSIANAISQLALTTKLLRR